MNRDQVLRWIVGSCASLAALLVVLVLVFLAQESWPLLANDRAASLLSDSIWSPLNQQYGMLAMLVGSVLVSAVALLIAFPLGLSIAVVAECLAPKWLAHFLSHAMGLMAGIPSVVYGLWGLTALVPLLARWQPPGTNLLAASIVLALMIIPTIALSSQSAFRAIPSNWLQGAAALGLSRESTISKLVLPAARQGIVAGVVLALARALGETMAVLMVAGNVVQIPGSLLDPVRVLTANIALEMAYATADHRAALFASGLLLALLVLALMLLTRWWTKEPFAHAS